MYIKSRFMLKTRISRDNLENKRLCRRGNRHKMSLKTNKYDHSVIIGTIPRFIPWKKLDIWDKTCM